MITAYLVKCDKQSFGYSKVLNGIPFGSFNITYIIRTGFENESSDQQHLKFIMADNDTMKHNNISKLYY
jgi:hypothetical protein